MLETTGSVVLLTDSYGMYYAKDSDGRTSAITLQGKHVSTSTWSDYSFAGVENIDGTNYAINQHTDGHIYKWALNAEWQYKSSELIRNRSSEMLMEESKFQQDFNNDSVIGSAKNYSTIESAGSVDLLTDSHACITPRILMVEHQLFHSIASTSLHQHGLIIVLLALKILMELTTTSTSISAEPICISGR